MQGLKVHRAEPPLVSCGLAFVGGKIKTVAQNRSWPGQKGFLRNENPGKMLETKKKKKKKTLQNKVAASLVRVVTDEVERRQDQTPWGEHSGPLAIPTLFLILMLVR